MFLLKIFLPLEYGAAELVGICCLLLLGGERQRWVITGNSISADNAREILKAESVVPLNIVLCSLNNLRGDETNATLSI